MTKPSKRDEELSYAAASNELDAILGDIETGTVDIDVLAKQVERAAFLIKLCRDRLAATELKVTKVIEDLETDAKDVPPEDPEAS